MMAGAAREARSARVPTAPSPGRGSVGAVPTRLKAVLTAALAALACAALAAPAPAATLLRLNGIGPLRLGMTRSAALATGWLAHGRSGCPLGGPPLPLVYRFSGPRAPRGIHGDAEFAGGRLRDLSFTGGVRTAVGVVVGRTSIRSMVSRYRAAGFTATATFDATFAGRFVLVSRHPGGSPVIGGFGQHTRVTTLAIPAVPVCE